jgi:hypothetical protein
VLREFVNEGRLAAAETSFVSITENPPVLPLDGKPDGIEKPSLSAYEMEGEDEGEEVIALLAETFKE